MSYVSSYQSILLVQDTDDNPELLKLKEEIISMLRDDANKPEQKLELVNAIQRLGVSYHFESEVREILEEVYKARDETDLGDGTDELYSISLRFRLLRQHGYKIPCGIFYKFFLLSLFFFFKFL